MTHRDEINNMSNEELAKKFIEINACVCYMCAYNKDCEGNNIDVCKKGIEEWLNMEVEE